VEFGVEIGEYRGVVRVPWRVLQRLLPERPTPERCAETRVETIASEAASAPVNRGWECRDQRADLR
jgi:hypothetical protein